MEADTMAVAVRCWGRRGRPRKEVKKPRKPYKMVRLENVVFADWRSKKIALGFEKGTDSLFASYLLGKIQTDKSSDKTLKPPEATSEGLISKLSSDLLPGITKQKPPEPRVPPLPVDHFQNVAPQNAVQQTPVTLLQQDTNKYPSLASSAVPSGQLLVGQQLPSVCLTVPTTGVVIPAFSSTHPLTGFQQVVLLNNQEKMQTVQPNLFQYQNVPPLNPGQQNLVQFQNVAPQIQNHQLPAAPLPTNKKEVEPFTEKTEIKVNRENNSFDEKEDTPDVEMSSKDIVKKRPGSTSEHSSTQTIAKTMDSHLYNLNSVKIEPGLHMEVEDGESNDRGCDTDCADEDILVNHNLVIVKKEINEMTTADDSVS